MKLEVGKTYLDERGKRVKIVERVTYCSLTAFFIGDNGSSYSQHGTILALSGLSTSDLIQEAPPAEDLEDWATIELTADWPEFGQWSQG